MKKETVKIIAISFGAFGALILSNVAAQSIYARTGITTDKKALGVSLAGGLLCAALVGWGIKK